MMKCDVLWHWILDLVVIDSLFAACGIAITKLTQAPYIIFNPSLLPAMEASHRSVPFQLSHFRRSHRFSITVPKNFVIDCTLLELTVEYVMPFSWNHILGTIIRDRFKELDKVPMITWFYKNPEFSWSDLPVILEHRRPLLPDFMNTAGHCKSAPPLKDAEWLSFIDDPTSKGTILLSFGHIVQWIWAPDEMVDNLFAAFNQFPDYRIVFQYDGKPRQIKKHIKTARWLPLVTILNHPKTKFHLTHGGLKTLAETICVQVPLVILPIFAEQLRNAESIKRIGAGIVLDKFNLTTENIVGAFRTVLGDDRYYNQVKKLKFFMTDTFRPSLDIGAFRAEQIIKRKRLLDAYNGCTINNGGLKVFAFTR